MGQFTCFKDNLGFTVEDNRIALRGYRSFLYTTALTGVFECLSNPDKFSSIFVSFTYALRTFSSTSRTGLFGTDPMEKEKGISAWIEKKIGSDIYVLYVEVRRMDRVWTMWTDAGTVIALLSLSLYVCVCVCVCCLLYTSDAADDC